ncbi:Type II secretion envelope pseudopilin protein (PulG,guides folded protein to PulD in outer membrane) [hydrothermal vent metagenome]|uniref:Type II secretion envelope pseudopilin protein (PulG,guides folded protein to PulD in outer membrane) n=1 Tax=hydrothermal vent metagenome TaxID=652676 RepID=A0A1W1EAX7_9ZZZZ
MQRDLRDAFTMIELVFVIVVIGILSAIALPRFSDTADTAYLTKAQSTLSAVRSALAAERQKRILRGDTTEITALNLSASGGSTSNAFDHFSADGDGNYQRVLDYPVAACDDNGRTKACWSVSDDGTTYSYKFVDDGQADFVLSGNRLDCDSDDTDDCEKITGKY